MMALKQFGPLYLTQAEYEHRWKQAMTSYYGFLAQSVLQQRSQEFWEHHRTEMANMGVPISNLRLFKALCLSLLDLRSAQRTYRRSRRQKQNTAPQLPQNLRQRAVSASETSETSVNSQFTIHNS
jgi:hypothetical protein